MNSFLVGILLVGICPMSTLGQECTDRGAINCALFASNCVNTTENNGEFLAYMQYFCSLTCNTCELIIPGFAEQPGGGGVVTGGGASSSSGTMGKSGKSGSSSMSKKAKKGKMILGEGSFSVHSSSSSKAAHNTLAIGAGFVVIAAVGLTTYYRSKQPRGMYANMDNDAFEASLLSEPVLE